VSDKNPNLRRSLFELISDIPDLIRDLIRAEIEAYKAQVVARGKSIAFGSALFIVALAILFWVVAVLIASAVLAFSLVLPPWAAALVVGAILIVIIIVLVVIGIAAFKAGTASFEESVQDSIGQDIDAVKGVGEYE